VKSLAKMLATQSPPATPKGEIRANMSMSDLESLQHVDSMNLVHRHLQLQESDEEEGEEDSKMVFDSAQVKFAKELVEFIDVAPPSEEKEGALLKTEQDGAEAAEAGPTTSMQRGEGPLQGGVCSYLKRSIDAAVAPLPVPLSDQPDLKKMKTTEEVQEDGQANPLPEAQ